MCGIVGVASSSADISLSSLALATDKLAHRGPDGRGVWASVCKKVALGHRRLSVIDLSGHAQQPMRSTDGRYTMVFNGEIYNFAALRDELEGLGSRFRSSGDTEVLLAAYMTWGEACLQRLNGMFAFAIHDAGNGSTRSSLFFARDRAGEKPFYFARTASSFSFASEPKALCTGGGIDLQALNHYLALGYIPDSHCLFEGLRKLPPGHCGRFDLHTGALSIRRYWGLPCHQPDKDASGDALAEEAGALIEDSVRLRLVADVPVGVLLSGGLDSSLVVAAAAHVSRAPVETFTIALPGSPLDEAHHAQKVASYFGTRHHVLSLSEPGLSLLDGLAPLIDEPIADSSILPAWLVFGLARCHVTVALGGDGGDELFGGYGDYPTSLADQRRWGWAPSAALRMLADGAAALPAGVKGRNRVASLRGGALQQMIWGSPYFDQRLRRRILRQDAVEALDKALGAPESFLLDLFQQGQDPMDAMTRTHFGSILPDDFLVKVDRASMAHSLEVRAPFLDYRLIEFAFRRIPSCWKVKGGETRRIQRMLGRKWLPPELDLQRKQGFSIPINEWLASEGEKRLMDRMEALPDCIRLDEVRSLVRGLLRGRTNGSRIFALVMLAIAMRNLRQS